MRARFTFCCAVTLAAVAVALGDGGTIKGKVDFKGDKPKFKEIDFKADPACAAMHGDPVRPEFIVVNENATLRDVFVYVKSGLPKKEWPVPTTPVTINQKGCMYEPHVLGVMAGQPIEIVNSDNTSHNIHAMPKTNAQFNIGQPKKDMKSTQSFKEPEMAVEIKCDVHGWMKSWAHVMNHPFFAVTGKDGTFEIKGLPDGDYEIEAWTERLGTQTAKVSIKGGAAAESNFTFERKKEGAKEGEKEGEKKGG